MNCLCSQVFYEFSLQLLDPTIARVCVILVKRIGEIKLANFFRIGLFPNDDLIQLLIFSVKIIVTTNYFYKYFSHLVSDRFCFLKFFRLPQVFSKYNVVFMHRDMDISDHFIFANQFRFAGEVFVAAFLL